jgi:hypothetical protein
MVMRILIVSAVLTCVGCVSANSASRTFDIASNPATSGPELLAITFKEGRPRDGDALLESVTDLNFTEHALDRDLQIIKRFTQLQFQVSGTTDDKECAPDTCDALSLRRARLVHDWFLRRGVQDSSLKSPIGRADKAPITDNATEDARSANRRAIVDFVMN